MGCYRTICFYLDTCIHTKDLIIYHTGINGCKVVVNIVHIWTYTHFLLVLHVSLNKVYIPIFLVPFFFRLNNDIAHIVFSADVWNNNWLQFYFSYSVSQCNESERDDLKQALLFALLSKSIEKIWITVGRSEIGGFWAKWLVKNMFY